MQVPHHHLTRLRSLRHLCTRAMRPPLLSVLGATGTGKSQLAVELALALNGEVISADAMQMYRGLPVITNKITAEERRGVPHHLLGHLDLLDESQVGRFLKEAEEAIEDVRGRGRLPIVVGGTHYYIQSLLFPWSIPAEEEVPRATDDLAERYPILNAPAAELYEHLKAVDPVMAARWHPNDDRKVRRSLEIYYSTDGKKTASEIYAEQRALRSNENSAPDAAAPMCSKYRNLVFWVHAEPEVLRKRLDDRVEKMIDSGMWEELEEMERLYDSLGGDADKGIWRSIGFKEFIPYLEMRKSPGSTPEELEKTKAASLNDMKTATRHYAKEQVKWVRIKFINALRTAQQNTANWDEQDTMFLMDSSDASSYNANVTQPAVKIAKDFLSNNPLPDPLSLSSLAKELLKPKRDYDFGQRPDLWVQRSCEICNMVATSEDQWVLHIQSRKHKKAAGSVKKREEIEKFIKLRKEKEQRLKDADDQRRRTAHGDVAGILEQSVQSTGGELVTVLEQSIKRGGGPCEGPS